MTEAEKTELFMAASRILTGIEELPVRLSDAYQKRLVDTNHATALDSLLAQFEALPNDPERPSKLIALVLQDPTLRVVAEQIVFLWYTSATLANKQLIFGTADEYFSSQLWTVIRAHPPALSGGYMGHWRYLPE